MSNNILNNSVLLRVEFRKLGNLRKGDMDKVQTEADKTRLRLGKKLFDSPQFAAIGSFDGELRSWLMRRVIYTNIGFAGVYVLPLTLLAAVEQRLAKAKDERNELVAQFMTVYDQERQLAQDRLGDQFRESDYPNAKEAESAFRFGWRYVTFEVPNQLPPEILEREKQQREETFRTMAEDVQLALRESLNSLVSHLIEKLTPTEGKKPIFRDTTINNLVEFLELFESRNVTNDQAMKVLCERARRIIGNSTPDYIRKDETARAVLRDEMETVKKRVTDLIIQSPSRRKFDFSD